MAPTDTSEGQLKVLEDRLLSVSIPDELKESVLTRLDQLKNLITSPSFLPELDRISKYIEWIVSASLYFRTQTT
jgi:hypothetical protein